MSDVRVTRIEGDPRTEACPGGPLLVRGATAVETSDGTRHPATRPVCAVCRCGKTARMPWCDGTHKLLPEDARPA